MIKFEQITSITVSSSRILATAGIFIFHLLGLYGVNNYSIDFISIAIFCFLTGYLSHEIDLNRYQWLKNRVYSIMIPYWLIILPALIINRLISYKNTTILDDCITFLGGNMFLDTKVYVIAWYITFILIIYLFICFQSLFKNKLLKFLAWVIGFSVFYIWLHKEYYFISVGIGFLLSNYYPPPAKKVASGNVWAKTLFSLQGYCYNFFLIHGGVLIFLFNILNMNMIESFFYGLILSSFGAIVLKDTITLLRGIDTVMIRKRKQEITF